MSIGWEEHLLGEKQLFRNIWLMTFAYSAMIVMLTSKSVEAEMNHRLYLFYYMKVMRYALPLSCLAFIGYVGFAAVATKIYIVTAIRSFLPWFLFAFFVPGTALGIYVFHRFRYHEYAFYRNKGVTFKRIILFTTVTNLALLAVFLFLHSLISF